MSDEFAEDLTKCLLGCRLIMMKCITHFTHPYAAKYYSLMKLSDEIDHHHILHFEVYEFISQTNASTG